MSCSPEEDVNWVDTHPREVVSRYLLHSGTEDVIALVVGDLD